MAAFAQARKTVQGGCNGGTFGAMAAKGTVIKSDPERAKMHDALKEGCVPEPESMRVFTREEYSSAVAQGCNVGQEGISAVGRHNTLRTDSLQGRETVRVQCISQRLRPKILRVRHGEFPRPDCMCHKAGLQTLLRVAGWLSRTMQAAGLPQWSKSAISGLEAASGTTTWSIPCAA